MSDYIKREDALDIILKYFPRSAKKLNIYREINNLPAADVAEVRHGRLISTGYDEQYCEFGDCTVCGADNLIHNKFCGHCGARPWRRLMKKAGKAGKVGKEAQNNDPEGVC